MPSGPTKYVSVFRKKTSNTIVWCLYRTKVTVTFFLLVFLPEASFGYCRSLHLSVCVCVSALQGQILLKSQNLPHFELVRTITHYPFKLGSQNWDKMCKIACFRSLLFWVAIDLDLKNQIWLKKSNFLVSPLLEIHNHHITTRDPWVPRLLHRPECFMVSILCTYLYT